MKIADLFSTKIHATLLSAFLLALIAKTAFAQEPWPVTKADAWAKQTGWLVGCNYTPSTAINQLEMWQADTFDPATIDRELGWAEQIGFNSVRVFLHNLLWDEDSQGFLRRMDQFLDIARKHHIRVVFVFFDSCWNPFPKIGKQPEPKPFVHNSGWVQSPGEKFLEHPEEFGRLKPYVQGVIRHFRNDRRIVMWDVYNEPGNETKTEPADKSDMTLILLQQAFAWAREVNPTQPLTSGVWTGDWSDPKKLTPIEKVQLSESDVISFHNYGKLPEMTARVEALQNYHRPIICTEYMARPMGSTFNPILKYLHDQKVGAFNWGFVSGKTQTIYPWDSWTQTYTSEPSVWFHDIFRSNGVPYDPKEIRFIQGITLTNPVHD